jgi:hypothetical protein
MANKWEKGSVKLVNGEDAFVDAINEGQEAYRYTGRIKGADRTWITAGWHVSGLLMYASSDHECNLAPAPKKTVRVQAWLLVSPNGYIAPLYDESDAIINAKKHGFALIPIDREVTEGEGL